eukprot:237103_1
MSDRIVPVDVVEVCVMYIPWSINAPFSCLKWLNDVDIEIVRQAIGCEKNKKTKYLIQNTIFKNELTVMQNIENIINICKEYVDEDCIEDQSEDKHCTEDQNASIVDINHDQMYREYATNATMQNMMKLIGSKQKHLIFGYIRHYEEIYSLIIPTPIVQLCLIYWWNGIWFEVKGTEYNMVRGRRPYAVYEFIGNLCGNDSIRWIILKRYRDFHLLHDQIKATAYGSRLLHNTIPQRRLTNRYRNPQRHEQRLKWLHSYLQFISSDEILNRLDIVVEFLQIPVNECTAIKQIQVPRRSNISDDGLIG